MVVKNFHGLRLILSLATTLTTRTPFRPLLWRSGETRRIDNRLMGLQLKRHRGLLRTLLPQALESVVL